MADALKVLNENIGAITAISTVLYLLLTTAIILDSRATRNLQRVALVDARLKAHTPAPMILELEVRNLGPAVARDVVIEYWLTDPAGDLRGERRRQGEQSLTAGEGVRFLPNTGGADFVNTLADLNVTVHVRWEWTDDRRRLTRPVRHRRSVDAAATKVRDDIYGGWALSETDPDTDLHEIADALRKAESHLKNLKDEIGRAARRRDG